MKERGQSLIPGMLKYRVREKWGVNYCGVNVEGEIWINKGDGRRWNSRDFVICQIWEEVEGEVTVPFQHDLDS